MRWYAQTFQFILSKSQRGMYSVKAYMANVRNMNIYILGFGKDLADHLVFGLLEARPGRPRTSSGHCAKVNSSQLEE